MANKYHHNNVFHEYDLPDEIECLINRESIKRCPRCGCLLYVGELGPGSVIEIECRKCKLRSVDVEPAQ